MRAFHEPEQIAAARRPAAAPLLAPAFIALALLAGCSKPTPDASSNSGMTAANSGMAIPASPSTSAATMPGSAFPTDDGGPPQNTDDPASFVPLRSNAVKDAIHQALRTGQTQRWQDGKLTGYAVPSLTTGANGCRAVRYTVDQRPNAAPQSITACDATPGG